MNRFAQRLSIALGLPAESITSPSRTEDGHPLQPRRAMQARQVLYYCARQSGESYGAIARDLGVSRYTVRCGAERVRNRLLTDVRLQVLVDEVLDERR